MRKIQCESCVVRTQGAICDLPEELLDEFRASSVAAIYKPRQVVFSEGSPALGLYMVCCGAVKLYQSDRFGRDHILEVAGPGSILGELPSNGDQILSVTAETVTESQLCFLPRQYLVAFLEKYPTGGIRLVAALSRELAAARRKVRDLALKGAESRLATLLVEWARAQGELAPGTRLQVGYTRRSLGEMVGVSTETAIRLLGKLRSRKIIRSVQRDIVIVDVEKLLRLANYDEVEE